MRFKSLFLWLMGFGYLCGSEVAVAQDFDPGEKWKLTWSDEFDGNALDRSKWNYELGQGQNGWGNGEWQVYTNSPENIWLQDGKLNIRALRQFTGSGGYTSARITTKGQANFQFGKIAARIKLPRGRSIWPAFWMMGAVSDVDQWPISGEIDVMEMRGGDASSFPNGDGGDKRIYGSLHYYHSKAPGHVEWGQGVGLDRPFAEDFHIFEAEWYDTHIVYKLDGKTYGMAQYNGVNEMHEFRAWPYYLLLQVAVGGPGTLFTGRLTPDDNAFPQTMQVDWVRVYQTEAMQAVSKIDYKPEGKVYNVSHEGLDAAGQKIGEGGRIDSWNPNGFSIGSEPGAEGQEAVVLRSDGSQNWFGAGFTLGSKQDLGGYRYLTVSLKTQSQATFKIGASHAYGSWVYFIPGSDPYGFKRDGQWHTLHIPMTDFLQPEFDWGHLDYPFALAAGGIRGPTEIAIDGVYYDGKSDNPDDYLLIPKQDTYFLDKGDREGSVDELQDQIKSQIWNFMGFENQTIKEGCTFGNDCQRLIADGTGYWFGFAYAGRPVTKLLGYTKLSFAIRTQSEGKLKVGIADEKGKEAWIQLQDSPYAVRRDGSWQTIEVPLSAFAGVDLQGLRNVFTIIGEEPKPYTIDLDAVKIVK